MLPTYPESKRRALARNILRNTLRLKRGENLLIESWSGTLDWAESLVLEARIVGARPLLILEDEPTYWQSVKEAPSANVGRVGSHEWAALKAADAQVYLYGPYDARQEEALPAPIASHVRGEDHEWFRLVQKLGVRCARWDLGRTSEYTAKRYGIDIDEWREELVEAAIVDPRELKADGERIAVVLRRGKVVHITHTNGTDLTLRLAGRPPRIDDGIVDERDVREGNVISVVPSGVTGVTVDEKVAEGRFVGNIPGILFAQGAESPLIGGDWTFRGGKLAKYSHTKGNEEFQRAWSRVGAGRERPGYLSIGLNPRIRVSPLLFDQIRGVVTLTVGRNSHWGGSTHTPHFHGYQSVEGASLTVDGKPLVEDGKLV